MTASNELIWFLGWSLPETAVGILCNCPVGALPYTRHTLRDTIIPLVRSQGSPPRTNDTTRPPAMVTAKNKTKQNGRLSSSRSQWGWEFLHRARRHRPNDPQFSCPFCWTCRCVEVSLIREWEPILPMCGTTPQAAANQRSASGVGGFHTVRSGIDRGTTVCVPGSSELYRYGRAYGPGMGPYSPRMPLAPRTPANQRSARPWGWGLPHRARRYRPDEQPFLCQVC